MLAVNPQAAVAARKPVRILHRRNVRPGAVLGIEFPNRAIGRAAGTGAVAIDHIQYALRIEARMNGHEIRGLAGNRLPGLARVGAAEQVAGAGIGRADVNRLRGFAPRSGAGIEHDETQSHSSCRRRRRRRGRARAARLPPRRQGPPRACFSARAGGSRCCGGRCGRCGRREAVHLFPSQRRVLAHPKPGRARAEIKNVVVVWINGQTLSDAPPVFIPAHPEGHLHHLESLALVHRTQDGRRLVLMHPAGDINALRVNRIGGDAFRAHEIVVGRPVRQRNPHLRLVVPLVGAADIGAAVGQARLGGVEDKPINEAPALHHDSFPSVRLGA